MIDHDCIGEECPAWDICHGKPEETLERLMAPTVGVLEAELDAAFQRLAQRYMAITGNTVLIIKNDNSTLPQA